MYGNEFMILCPGIVIHIMEKGIYLIAIIVFLLLLIWPLILNYIQNKGPDKGSTDQCSPDL